MSIEGRYEWAVALIAIAAFLDGLDGRVARFLKSSSRFGAELEFDHRLPQFRRRPGILLYVWALARPPLARLDGGAGLRHLRGAPPGALQRRPRRSREAGWQSNYFVGVPAPAGAMTVLLPVYMEFVGTPHGFWTAPLVLVYTLAIGLLMVSRVPTWSGKLIGRRISRDMVLPLFVVVVVARRASSSASPGRR